MSSTKPTVNVDRERSGGYRVTGVVQLPECSVSAAYRAVSDFTNYTSWNPGLKQFVPIRESSHNGGPSTIRVVQNVGALSFSKTFTTYIQAEPQPTEHKVSFSLVSSDLYHQYRANFSVEDPPKGQGGVLVKYDGHFNMKFGPPPPLGRVLMPRSLQSAITDMLIQLQQQPVVAAGRAVSEELAAGDLLGSVGVAC